MNKKCTLMTAGFLAFLSSLSLLGSVALADDHPNGMKAAIARGRANVSLEEVIDKVATDSNGRVVEIHFEEMDSFFSFGDGPLVYEVEAVTPEGVMEYRVDPKDGNIISSNRDRLATFHYRNLPEGMELTLKQAIAKAEKTRVGVVTSATLEEEGGNFFYHLRINEAGTDQSLLIDPLNGNIYPVSSHHSEKGNDDHES
ncbi:PepSY domain-containing protein [Desulfoluna sp.]|uniref:PepSY domain-containing protein n=1 Tax=Desulfoluna sp. TaxID=2045199 RepID=UPI0026064A34|nr:PepSY domain-containing protein [Desulfoluna sp.]